jgi:hypothetical protein
MKETIYEGRFVLWRRGVGDSELPGEKAPLRSICLSVSLYLEMIRI